MCFEGAEKIWAKLSGHHPEESLADAAVLGADEEQRMVAGAIRTDFILSAEIMVIALKEVATEAFVARAVILVVVAIVITLLVYGVVGLIVKMDDVGLRLAERDSPAMRRIGRGLVSGMPAVLAVISSVGTLAMLWVGGHLLLVGLDEVGWHALYGFVHHLEEQVHHATGVFGGALGWLTNTFFSLVLGLIVGGIVVALLHVLPIGKKGTDTPATAH